MKDNPFSSSIFIDKWVKHFCKSKKVMQFDFIKGVSFIKNSVFPIYINTGKNLTKGMTYSIIDNQKDYKGKVFLIYDIPDYFKVSNKLESSLKLKAIKQYSGFLVNLDEYQDIDLYLKSKFGKSSLSKIRKYKRKLEQSFNIQYDLYFGEISRDTYDLIFITFRSLLEKRFVDKKTHNNNLDEKEWDFYYDIIYDMILDKKASIYVVYDNDKPIGGSINYHFKDTAIGAIMIFDTDYSKFYIGFTIINKLLEWGIDNEIKTFDFSKGKFGYKQQWSDAEYDFNYHILYDNNSFFSRLLSVGINSYFRFKNKLREIKINVLFSKIKFLLNIENSKKNIEYTIIDTEEIFSDLTFRKIDVYKKEFDFLKRPFYDCLYATSQQVNDVEICQHRDQEKSFLFISKLCNKKINFK